MTSRDVDRLWVRDTLLVIEHPKNKDPNIAWPLELWAAHDGKNQVWVFEECESRLVKSDGRRD